MYPHPSVIPPTWPWALSGEFDPAVNKWWMGLWCFSVSGYWRKSINKCVAKPQPLKWLHNWVFNALNDSLMLGGNYFTQHLLSISTQHPFEKYGSDISLFGAYYNFISHLLNKSRNAGHHGKINLNLRLLTGMPWLTTSCAPPWLRLGGIPPSITVWGMILFLWR